MEEVRRWGGMNLVDSGGMQAGETQRRRHSVGRCGTSRKSRDVARKTTPGVRSA